MIHLEAFQGQVSFIPSAYERQSLKRFDDATDFMHERPSRRMPFPFLKLLRNILGFFE